MNFKDLENVNAKIKKIDVKGKNYAQVNERILAFRQLFPNGSITSEIVSIANGMVIIKATARDENNRVLASGLAYEKENSSFINKTSYIENAETSAVGRCLGMIGIGVDDNVASYEEVSNAQVQQKSKKKDEEPKTARERLRKFCEENYIEQKTVISLCGLSEASSEEDFEKALRYAAENLM